MNDKGHSNGELLTPQELADRLRIPLRKVQESSLGRNPKIPCIRISRMCVRYDWPTVVKALTKGTLVIILFGLTTGVAGEPQTGGRGNNLPSVTRETISFAASELAKSSNSTKPCRQVAPLSKAARQNPVSGAAQSATPELGGGFASTAAQPSKAIRQVVPLVMIGARLNPASGVATLFGERHRGKPSTSGELCFPNALSCASWFNPSGARLSLLGIIAAFYGLAVLGTLTHVARLTLKRTV